MRAPHQLLHSRTRLRRRYALFPLEGYPPSKLPMWPDVEARMLTAPAMGAGFAEYLLTMRLAKARRSPLTAASRRFFMFCRVNFACGSRTILPQPLKSGGYALVGPHTDFEVRTVSDGTLLMLRKAYEPISGVAAPRAVIGDVTNVSGEPFHGDEGARLQTLLPDELAFDLAMNIFTFEPGHSLPVVETHVMEHGLYFLARQGPVLPGRRVDGGRGRRLHLDGSLCAAIVLCDGARPREIHLLQEREPRRGALTCSGIRENSVARRRRNSHEFRYRIAAAQHAGPNMEKIYRDADVDMTILDGKVVAVIGYGIQGKVQAANARDSGVKVIIGTRSPDVSPSRAQAKADGFEAMSIGEATRTGRCPPDRAGRSGPAVDLSRRNRSRAFRRQDALLLPRLQRAVRRDSAAEGCQRRAVCAQRAGSVRPPEVSARRGRLWLRQRRSRRHRQRPRTRAGDRQGRRQHAGRRGGNVVSARMRGRQFRGADPLRRRDRADENVLSSHGR